MQKSKKANCVSFATFLCKEKKTRHCGRSRLISMFKINRKNTDYIIPPKALNLVKNDSISFPQGYGKQYQKMLKAANQKFAAFFIGIKTPYYPPNRNKNELIRCVIKWAKTTRRILPIIDYQPVQRVNILIKAGNKLTFV